MAIAFSELMASTPMTHSDRRITRDRLAYTNARVTSGQTNPAVRCALPNYNLFAVENALTPDSRHLTAVSRGRRKPTRFRRATAAPKVG